MAKPIQIKMEGYGVIEKFLKKEEIAHEFTFKILVGKKVRVVLIEP